jgi:hypothetical protein
MGIQSGLELENENVVKKMLFMCERIFLNIANKKIKSIMSTDYRVENMLLFLERQAL